MSPEDRNDFLAETVKGTSELVRRYGDTGNDELINERIADSIALTIAIMHQFNDGNGRTSRVIALLIREGYDPNNAQNMADHRIVGNNRTTDNGFRINSFLPKADKNIDEVIESALGLNIPPGENDRYKKEANEMYASTFE